MAELDATVCFALAGVYGTVKDSLGKKANGLAALMNNEGTSVEKFPSFVWPLQSGPEESLANSHSPFW